MPPPPRPFIPALNCARLELIYDQNGQICENVVYLRAGAVWGTSDLEDLTDNVGTIWDATLGTITNANTTLTLMRATGLDTFPGPQVEQAAAATGAIAGAAMPGNVTVATKFSGGLTGRSTRGRAYFVGLAAVDYVGNQLAATVAGLITAAWHDFFEQIASVVHGTPEHVIVSYVADGAWRTEALVTKVINYTTENNLDSQRRRLTGRGL